MLSLLLYSRGWKQGWDEAAGTAPIHPSRESSLLFTETWAYRVRFQGTLICKEGLRALETASDGSYSRDQKLWLGHCLAMPVSYSPGLGCLTCTRVGWT